MHKMKNEHYFLNNGSRWKFWNYITTHNWFSASTCNYSVNELKTASQKSIFINCLREM